MVINFLNSEGHQNTISGLKVTAILLKGWILPIGGASSGSYICIKTDRHFLQALKNLLLAF